MKIAIQEHSGRNFRIVVPTGLLLNRLTARFIPGLLERKGFTLNRKQVMEIAREIRSFRKKHRDWKLIEVQSASGDHVEISL